MDSRQQLAKYARFFRDFEAEVAELDVYKSKSIEALIDEIRANPGSGHWMRELALIEWGEAAKVALIEEFQNFQSEARWQAADILAKIGGEKVFKLMLEVITSGDQYARQLALGALMELGDERAFTTVVIEYKRFIKAYGETPWLYQMEESQKEDAILDFVFKNMENSRIRKAVAKPLGLLEDDQGLRLIISTFQKANTPVPIVEPEKILNDESIVTALVKELRNDPELYYGNMIVKALTWMGKLAVQPIIALLEDADNGTREYAVGILYRIGDEKAILPLIQYLRNNKDDHPLTRRLAIHALGQFRDTRAVEILVDNLKDKHSYIRAVAAMALGNIGDSSVLPLLIEMEQHDQIIYRPPIFDDDIGSYPNAATEAIRRIKANQVEIDFHSVE